MYEPLRFMKQCEDYIRFEFESGRNKSYIDIIISSVNKASLNWIGDNICNNNENIAEFVYEFVKYHLGGNVEDEYCTSIYDRYKSNIEIKVGEILHTDMYDFYRENYQDFMRQMLQGVVYNEWKYHKLSYKVNDYLANLFIDMDLPKEINTGFIAKFPSTVFYIDMENVGERICENLKGVFVVSTSHNEVVNMQFILMIDGTQGRVLPSYHCICMPEESFVSEYLGRDSDYDIQKGEDGVVRNFNTTLFMRFILNFMIYLNASNRDVVMSSKSEKNQKKLAKLKKEPRNNPKELVEYEVGYKLSTPITLGSVSSSGGGTGSGKGSAKSPHYRSAHWHSFWTGAKGSKQRKLVVKWVDGVFVNGKHESDVAVVHEVK